MRGREWVHLTERGGSDTGSDRCRRRHSGRVHNWLLGGRLSGDRADEAEWLTGHRLRLAGNHVDRCILTERSWLILDDLGLLKHGGRLSKVCRSAKAL